MNYFDEKTFANSMAALSDLTETACILNGYWRKLCTEELTTERYQEWLNDRELIFRTYLAEKQAAMDPALHQFINPRPTMDEGKTAGRYERTHNTAGQFLRPMDGSRVVASVADVEFKDGKPVITEAKQQEIRQRCTVKIGAKQQPFIEALKSYCESYNRVNDEARKLMDTWFAPQEIPVTISDGRAEIAMSDLVERMNRPSKMEWAV